MEEEELIKVLCSIFTEKEMMLIIEFVKYLKGD